MAALTRPFALVPAFWSVATVGVSRAGRLCRLEGWTVSMGGKEMTMKVFVAGGWTPTHPSWRQGRAA